MTDSRSASDFRIHVEFPYEEAIERVVAALKEEGFGILTEIDVKATLKKKLNVDFQRYVILGACNPTLAYQALSREPEVGLLLPCNVIVYEGNGGHGSVISFVDPIEMLGGMEDPELRSVANEAKSKLRRVVNQLID